VNDRGIVECLAETPGMTVYELDRRLRRRGLGGNTRRILEQLEKLGRVRSEREQWPCPAGFRVLWYAVPAAELTESRQSAG
jgi:hypothetical protein